MAQNFRECDKLVMHINSVTLHSILFTFHYVTLSQKIYLFHVLPILLITANYDN